MSTIPAIKHFGTGDRVYVQAQRIWLILVARVMSTAKWNRKQSGKITYGDLAILMGYQTKRAGHMLARQLGIVGTYCRENGLPTLNSIVVNDLTQQPGSEVVLRPKRNVAQEQAAVISFDWFAIRVPTTGTFRKVWESLAE